MVNEEKIKEIAKNVRIDILEMCHQARTSHVGAALSIVEILSVLYFGVMNIEAPNLKKRDRDIFILSKGHAAPALYSVLKEKKIISADLKSEYCSPGSYYGQHTSSKIPGIEFSTGSLGHGLSVAAGMAIANRIDNVKSKIFVLLGDGECNEGSIWEAAQFISSEKLKIAIIVDANGHQGLDTGSRILPKEKNKAMWSSLGFNAVEVDGHSIKELYDALSAEIKGPTVIIAKTIKGKGVKYMEDKFEWHYKSPDDNQLEEALKEF